MENSHIFPHNENYDNFQHHSNSRDYHNSNIPRRSSRHASRDSPYASQYHGQSRNFYQYQNSNHDNYFDNILNLSESPVNSYINESQSNRYRSHYRKKK